MSRWISLVVFLALCAAAASSGATFPPGAWYAALAKPSWTPPPWVFPVVWTTLYVMIAIAGWLVWRKQGLSPLLGVWAAQLVLNAAWSAIMFGAHNIGGALAELILLWLAIVAFIVMTWRPVHAAALLFLPYLAWVTTAGFLNLAIYRLNA